MAVAATLPIESLPPLISNEPEVFELTQLASEDFTRAKAERFIGSVVAGSEVAVSYEAAQSLSLLEAVRRAAEGDREAILYVQTCVRTDVIERSIKAGHITRITQAVDDEGHLVQYGQTGRSIQANSLTYATQNPKMRPRVEAETRNLFRIEDAHKQGLLEDYWVVVVSRAADNMTDEELHQEGFFVDTMSIALQATTADGRGNLLTESAFVAGKVSRNAERHDRQMVRQLAAELGLDVGEVNATEMLDRPWLIHRNLMPNGVIDLVQLADKPQGTFFGQDKPQEDYLAYLAQCEQREAELASTVQDITQGLLAEVNQLLTPLDATQKLHELSEAHLVRRAVVDQKIDTTVFGTESAHYIEAARYYQQQGEQDKVHEFLVKAIGTADSSSCPGAGSKQSAEGKGETARSKEEDGDCDFISKKCPMCGAKNVRTLVRKMTSGKKIISGSCGCSKEFSNS